VSIVKLKTFGTNFNGSLPFWTDGTEAHKTALMCVDAVESKYQSLNKCKLLFKLVVHQQQPLEESLSITTGRCDLAIATHARKMHKNLFVVVHPEVLVND
jgi:hypothetical protein